MEGSGERSWKVLEFYSGIGGMRYSLMKAGVNAEVVEAFDINNVANDVYELNFGHRPYQGNIQTLSAVDLSCHEADVWLLSPPCQPYTRQGLQKGSGDARASSFLKILELISQIPQPPIMLFVENVVGFEVSDTHQKMISLLQKNCFDTQEFILSPLQFGVPYSRPRYFCLAKRKPLTFRKPEINNELIWDVDPVLGYDRGKFTGEELESCEYNGDLREACRPIKEYLDLKSSFCLENVAKKSVGTEERYTSSNPLTPYLVPPSLIERWGSAMDIVFPESRRCCCFTKSYFRYVKGTGSFLATAMNYEQKNSKDEMPALQELCLRYFTPREVANLHSFPEDFQFPPHVSLRQQYALLGNSLSVGVVAPLLCYLFSE